MSRLPVSRWVRIGAWTGAAVAWGTTVIVAREVAPADAADAVAETEPEPVVSQAEVTAPVPSMPESGLVILRYTPIPDPEPKVITRRVTVNVPAGGGGGTTTARSGGGSSTAKATSSPAPSGGGVSTVAPPPPAPAPAPAPTTAAPAPTSGGS